MKCIGIAHLNAQTRLTMVIQVPDLSSRTTTVVILDCLNIGTSARSEIWVIFNSYPQMNDKLGVSLGKLDKCCGSLCVSCIRFRMLKSSVVCSQRRLRLVDVTKYHRKLFQNRRTKQPLQNVFCNSKLEHLSVVRWKDI